MACCSWTLLAPLLIDAYFALPVEQQRCTLWCLLASAAAIDDADAVPRKYSRPVLAHLVHDDGWITSLGEIQQGSLVTRATT